MHNSVMPQTLSFYFLDTADNKETIVRCLPLPQFSTTIRKMILFNQCLVSALISMIPGFFKLLAHNFMSLVTSRNPVFLSR